MASTLTLTDENFDATAHKGGTLFLDFWATNCEFCAEFAPVFEAAAKKQKKAMFAKINVDEQEGLADDFDIEVTPTLIVIRDGVVVAREEGSLSAKELEEVAAGVAALDMDFIRSELAAEENKAAKKAPAVKKKAPAAKKKVPAAKKKSGAKKK